MSAPGADAGSTSATAGRWGDPDDPRYSPDWLALREPADAAARAGELVDTLRPRLRGRPVVICDLGCGTGAMARWLAPRLPGPQHWLLVDRDPDLLARAVATLPPAAGDGAPVTATAHRWDVTDLTPGDLSGVDLVTASALLDLLTADEVGRLADGCARAGCPALLALTVTGDVTLAPPDRLDAPVTAAFNTHQRRVTGGRRLLGPDAVEAAVAAFTGVGMTVMVRQSPWRLGPNDAALVSAWLHGRVAAACAARPDLTEQAADYLERRLTAAAADGSQVVVDHFDLLAL